MAVYKCKMCGGTLEIAEGMTVCECDYCGTKQTLPKTDNEQNLNMFNRANHFRQQCEFDKAAEIYEKMANRSEDDAELYWSIVLCRYGIEYVDDPLTKKKIPTCHRTQFRSILDDPDYQTALEHADMLQRSVYESEAAYIDKVQKGILEISNKEQPFDVFICYKETDENGRRTPDSVLAQELYYGLSQEGFKVFFSRITLESKLGTEYEPYIFAALNSSRIMVVVGTKPEYFNAVWVRNEWSRYLMLMQADRSRTIIPAYKDMDPYDLPDALSMFQAQDMSKLGFMQDLIRGIRKLAAAEAPVKEVQKVEVAVPANANVENLIKRGNLALEDKEWEKADDFFEQVLNENVEEPRAYVGKLMSQLNICTEEDFCSLEVDFSEYDNYKKAFRFADDNYREKISSYLSTALSNKNRALYDQGLELLGNAKSFDDFLNCRAVFESLDPIDGKDVSIQECNEKMYDIIIDRLENAYNDIDVKWVKSASDNLSGYYDLSDFEIKYNSKLEEITKNEGLYQQAVSLLKNGNTEEFGKAIDILESIIKYRDSSEIVRINKQRYITKVRTEEYDEKLDTINEERKSLYEENSSLGLFAGKRKKEIESRLRELYNMEEELNSEYSDVAHA